MQFIPNLITIRTPRQLDALSIQTYILGAVAGIAFLLIAAIISNVIKFEGGSHPKDPGKRRLWFWTCLVISFIAVFLYNFYMVAITVAPNLQPKFMTVNVTGSAIAAITFLLVGFIVSKIFPTGKLGNWFSVKKVAYGGR